MAKLLVKLRIMTARVASTGWAHGLRWRSPSYTSWSYDSSEATSRSWRSAMSASASMSDWDITYRPVGLPGVITSSTRVAGVIACSTACQSMAKSSLARVPTRTRRAPRGSTRPSTKKTGAMVTTSSPVLRVTPNTRSSACMSTAVISTCASGSTARPSSHVLASATAVRSSTTHARALRGSRGRRTRPPRSRAQAAGAWGAHSGGARRGRRPPGERQPRQRRAIQRAATAEQPT